MVLLKGPMLQYTLCISLSQDLITMDITIKNDNKTKNTRKECGSKSPRLLAFF